MPFQFLVALILGLIGVAYWGYLRLTGADVEPVSRRASSRSTSSRSASAGRAAGSDRRNRPNSKPNPNPDTSIDDELERLRRKLGK